MRQAKTSQLQIRVSPEEKKQIEQRARRAQLSMSEWVLAQLLSPGQRAFENLCSQLAKQEGTCTYELAALNDLLARLPKSEFSGALTDAPSNLSPFQFAYVSAMVEFAASIKEVQTPDWAHRAIPLSDPYFASPLKSLRLHLLVNSPPPFKRRNLFIDSSVGERV